ncbi:MAG: thiamine-phosphate kinase [Caldimicrobium sp.]
MTEQELIEYLKKYLFLEKPIYAAYNEDCSVIKLKKEKYLLLTTDAMVEGIHFDLTFTDFKSLGYKLAACNLSDIAAMGGEPKWALLTLGAPKPPEKDWIDPFMKGLTTHLKKYKAFLVGGDTVKSPFFFFNLTLIGETGAPILRSGAKVGDYIFVSKPLGGCSAFLRKKKENREKISPSLQRAYLRPKPEILLGTALQKIAYAAIDISDGLVLDLYRLCQASGVSAEIDESLIPIAQGATLFDALFGGEDYALLFTVPENNLAKLQQISKKLKRSLYLIGRTKKGKEKVYLKRKEGRIEEIAPLGYDHFTSQPQL